MKSFCLRSYLFPAWLDGVAELRNGHGSVCDGGGGRSVCVRDAGVCVAMGDGMHK